MILDRTAHYMLERFDLLVSGQFRSMKPQYPRSMFASRISVVGVSWPCNVLTPCNPDIGEPGFGNWVSLFAPCGLQTLI